MSSTRMIVAALAGLACTATVAIAQTSPGPAGAYPARAVRTVIGYTPGGTTDIVARILGLKLNELWGQTVLVDARPGAAGNLAAEIIARSPPDGYNLLLAQNSLAVSPALYRKLNYNAQRDLVPVTSATLTPHVIVVHPSLPVRTVKDIIALGKARKGELIFASTGHGNSDHMAAELFNTMAGVKMVHVPYKGGALALTATASGEVPIYYPGLAPALAMMKANKVRAIAVTTRTRAKATPEIPTIAESGLPGYEAVLWYGYFAPAATPKDIVAKLSTDINRVLAMSDTIERLAAAGTDPFPGSPDQFAGFLKSEIVKWGGLVKKLGLELE